jgi:hypothetical protein
MTLLLLTLLAAASTEIEATEVSPQGWTKDGRYFAWTRTAVFDEDDVYKALDAKTGQVVGLGDEADFKKWTGAHPLAPLEPGREPKTGGKATADVKLIAGKGAGAWNAKATDEQPKDSRWAPASATAAELRVERDGASWVSVSWTGSLVSVQPFWSPGGKQVAWLARAGDWQSMDGTKTWQLVIGPGGFPRVHVVGDKALLGKAVPKVRDLLDDKGFITTYAGKSLKARDKSVVYAAKGQEALAAKAAALVPGGATVDKLTWNVNAELVVALGKSVNGGAP